MYGHISGLNIASYSKVFKKYIILYKCNMWRDFKVQNIVEGHLKQNKSMLVFKCKKLLSYFYKRNKNYFSGVCLCPLTFIFTLEDLYSH